jgi:hypothetical protein
MSAPSRQSRKLSLAEQAKQQLQATRHECGDYTYEVGGETVTLHQSTRDDAIAGRLWTGGEGLVIFMEEEVGAEAMEVQEGANAREGQAERRREGARVFWRGKRVVELGAGAGAIPSLAAALLGASKVLATDLVPEVLVDLQENIARNIRASAKLQALDAISTMPYAFGADTRPLGECDVVLGAAVLYARAAIGPLCVTLAQLLGSVVQGDAHGSLQPPQAATVAYITRDEYALSFEGMLRDGCTRAGLAVTVVACHAPHTSLRGVYRIVRAPREGSGEAPRSVAALVATLAGLEGMHEARRGSDVPPAPPL